MIFTLEKVINESKISDHLSLSLVGFAANGVLNNEKEKRKKDY
jgi:hypothetical protein